MAQFQSVRSLHRWGNLRRGHLPVGLILDNRGPSATAGHAMVAHEGRAWLVAEYEVAGHGEQGAILRREELYSSHIVEWCLPRGPDYTLDHEEHLMALPNFKRRDFESDAI